jgi:CRP/FNR family transcriptional regulator, anaerobic regulatory protein
MQLLTNYLLKNGLTEIQSIKVTSIFYEVIVLEKDEFFHKENQICDKIGFIVDGMCRYFYHTEKEDITRWVSLKNEFVTSLSSFITENPSVENIQAIKKMKILVAKKIDWEKLYLEEEFFRLFWLKNIETNYIGMETRVFNLIAMSAGERYNWMLKNQPKFNLLVPDKYVASMLGIKPRHLSRIRLNTK